MVLFLGNAKSMLTHCMRVSSLLSLFLEGFFFFSFSFLFFSRSMGPQTTFLSSSVESISGKQRAVSSSSPSYGAIVEYVASPPLVRHFSSSSAEECKLKHINHDATQLYSSKSPVSTENSSGCCAQAQPLIIIDLVTF